MEIEKLFDSIWKNLDQNELNAQCHRWALAHGFVQRRWTENIDDDSFVIPYPFTIFPSPYPAEEFYRAKRIQTTINALVQRLAFDTNLMDRVLQHVVHCDPFLRRLRTMLDQIEALPYRSVAESCIIRTDYMLQHRNVSNDRTKLRLIEINTIAVGLGAAAKLMHSWHKRVLQQYRPELLSQLPENESHDLIVETLFHSWKLYQNPQAIILFVVPEREFNIGDQLLIEFGLLARDASTLLVKHVTFNDIHRHCSIDAQGTLTFGNREVALVYYRCGYDPKHFSSEDIWQAYLMLESSRAIKCPSLRYHLAGMKCFQLAFVENNFLQEIFSDDQQSIDDMRQITEKMFTLDQVTNDPVLQQRISAAPESFYLKQSREGGGNVYCGDELRDRINQIVAEQQSKRYFVMSRIYGPTHLSLIRSDSTLSMQEINGELGIFGSLISQNGVVVQERFGGSLLRSKPATNIEGGIATGQGCIDSVVLI